MRSLTRCVACPSLERARLLGLTLILTLLASTLGCREDAESPTGPAPALEVSAAAAPLSFAQVSANGFGSGAHTCGVTTDGRAYCWGLNTAGQLGIGSVFEGPEDCGNPCSTRPMAVVGGHRWLHVRAGDRFTCGLTTDNLAYCWGRNFEGQLGSARTFRRMLPLRSRAAASSGRSGSGSPTPAPSRWRTSRSAGATNQPASWATARPSGQADPGAGAGRFQLELADRGLHPHLRGDVRQQGLLLGIELRRQARGRDHRRTGCGPGRSPAGSPSGRSKRVSATPAP